MLKKLFGLALALLATLAVSAQVRVGEGQLSGSFESNSIYYQTTRDWVQQALLPTIVSVRTTT